MTCRATFGLTLFMLTAALVRGTPDDRAPATELREDMDRQYVAPRPLSASDLWAHGKQDGTSVIIAQSVRTEADLELVQLPAVRPSAAGSFSAGQTGVGQGSKALPPVTRLGTIFRSDNATAFAGSSIDLAAARVQRVFDPEFIAVGRDIQHSILVRLAEPTPSIVAGDMVALSGIIEKSPESWPDRTVTQLSPVFIYARHVEPVTH
jgi:hypothetical protein